MSHITITVRVSGDTVETLADLKCASPLDSLALLRALEMETDRLLDVQYSTHLEIIAAANMKAPEPAANVPQTTPSQTSALVAEARRSGIVLWSDGTRLKFDAPRGLPSGLATRIRTHKSALLHFLSTGQDVGGKCSSDLPAEVLPAQMDPTSTPPPASSPTASPPTPPIALLDEAPPAPPEAPQGDLFGGSDEGE